jgi:hypothetical protein
MARLSRWIGALLVPALAAAGPLLADDSLPTPPQSNPVLATTDIDVPSTGQFSTTLPGEACCASSECGQRKLGFIAYADYLNWDAGVKGLGFASVARAPLDSPPDVLATQSLDFGNSNGVRVGLGYRFANNWDVTWNYTHFRNQTSAAALTSGLMDTALLASHSVFNSTPMSSIHADASLAMRIHDFEANYYACLDEAVSFRMFGGLRLAEIDQGFETAYMVVATAREGQISLPSQMDAAGGRLGAEISRRSESGFRIFARGGISYLSADFHTRQRETFSNQTVIDLEQTTTRFVSVLEGAAGVGWQRGPLEVDVGYEMNDWINMLAADGTVQDLFVRGLFVRLAFVH